MCNVCNIGLPQAMGDVISSIGIGTAAADSIGFRAPAQYRSNPTRRDLSISSLDYDMIPRTKASETLGSSNNQRLLL